MSESDCLIVTGLTVQGTAGPILRDVSFAVGRGERVSVIGPNGAGKSTLLKSIVGALPYRGEVFLEGENNNRISARRRATLLSYLPQSGISGEQFTVLEHLALSRFSHGELSRYESVVDYIQGVSEHYGIQTLLPRRLDTLSGGERQRIYLLGALLQGAPLLLLDEPGVFVDPQYEEAFFSLLRRADGGECRNFSVPTPKATLFVTHDLNRAILESDRILCMSEGVLIETLNPASPTIGEALSEIFRVNFSPVLHGASGRYCVIPSGGGARG